MSSKDRQAVATLLAKPPQSINREEKRYLVATVCAEDWQAHSDALLALIEVMLNKGFSRDALDVLLRADTEDHLRTQQLRAWAYRTSGAPGAAARILADLRTLGNEDAETLGFSGSVEKDLARQANSPDAALTHWRNALEYYGQAFARHGDYWNGINAATLSVRCGLIEQSRDIASRVAALCERESRNGAAGYYPLATLAQAALVMGDLEKARWAYTRAISADDADIGRLGRDKNQAQDLLETLGYAPDELANVFQETPVVVFAGHRVDVAGQERGFNAGTAETISDAFLRHLKDGEIRIGYAAAADGADILFLEALADLGGQLHIVLPTDVETFEKHSVAPGWVTRYRRLIAMADSLTVTGDNVDPGDESALAYAHQVTLGMAQLKARELATRVEGLALWDGLPGVPGSTADSVAHWRANGIAVTAFDVARLAATPVTRRPHTNPPSRPIMAMVNADVIGYSQLSELEVAAYYGLVLPKVATLCERFRPIVKDTFGDAFYFVFESVAQGAQFALALQSLFLILARGESGLPRLTVRIATHAGPLLACYDPIRDAPNYTGRHASRVARVEPVADENQILATQQFAALVAVQCPESFELVYAGERILPKAFGSERLYVLKNS